MSFRPYSPAEPSNIHEASVLIYDESGCRHMVVSDGSAVHFLGCAATALECAQTATRAMQVPAFSIFSKKIRKAALAERRKLARRAVAYTFHALLAIKLGYLC